VPSISLASTFPAFAKDLKYFHHMPATVVRPSRDDLATRLTPSAALRFFCKCEDAGLIWDTILAEA